jgi:hypothetical protein
MQLQNLTGGAHNRFWILFPANIISLFILSILFQACKVDQSSSVTATPTVTSSYVPTEAAIPVFDGDRALQHIATQLDFGPRTPGSEGHNKIVSWMVDELQTTDWDADVQELSYGDYMIQNVVAKRGQGAPWIIVGAHYDTRFFADQDPDPDKRKQPVPGANDGASGVAVLLELARVLPADLPGEIWLVFFDAEDNGDIPGWDWILGSQAFVEVLEGQPDAVVIVDMIGDAEQQIYCEKNSHPDLKQEIWQVAENLGYDDHFISKPGYRILDDHIPFLQAGIPAVDIIDFDYPAWHTVDDSMDKVSAQSLQVVGEVLYQWLLTNGSSESSP